MPLRYPRRRIMVDGFDVRFHAVREWIARELIRAGSYEKDDLAVLCSLVAPGDTVADIGANIGLHTMYLSRAVGPSGRVFAVEPDPSNLELLHRNLAKNGCTNVTVLPYAVADTEGVATLYLCGSNKGFQGLANLSGSSATIEVPVRRADDLLAGARPSVIKIDVEGAEPLVLAGITDWPACIFFEFVPRQWRAFGTEPEAFLRSIEERGYDLFQVEAGQQLPTSAGAMTTLAEATGAEHNLLARRR